ncbi:MAG: hypothetical protein [Methanosarcina spindle-shaped virus 1]
MRVWFAKSQKSAMLWLKRVQGRRPRAHVKNLAGGRAAACHTNPGERADVHGLMEIYNGTTLGQQYTDAALFYRREIQGGE